MSNHASLVLLLGLVAAGCGSSGDATGDGGSSIDASHRDADTGVEESSSDPNREAGSDPSREAGVDEDGSVDESGGSMDSGTRGEAGGPRDDGGRNPDSDASVDEEPDSDPATVCTDDSDCDDAIACTIDSCVDGKCSRSIDGGGKGRSSSFRLSFFLEKREALCTQIHRTEKPVCGGGLNDELAPLNGISPGEATASKTEK